MQAPDRNKDEGLIIVVKLTIVIAAMIVMCFVIAE